MAGEHVEISAAQRAAGNKKFQELMAAEKPVESAPVVEVPEAGAQDTRKDTAVTDTAEKVQEEKKVVPEPEKVPEKKDEPVVAEEADEPPVDEADAIALQESLLNDEVPLKKEPKDKDKTPLEERVEWKKARLREKQRIEALERDLAALRAQPPVAQPSQAIETPAPTVHAPVVQTPAAIEDQVDAMEKDWNDGKHPDWDFARLEREKMTVVVQARVAAQIAADRAREQKESEEKRVRESQAETTARIDKAITKTEAFLPGLKEAFTALAKDPVFGPDPIIGQAVMQNLDKGGLHVVYYLHHHRDFASSLLDLPVDERAKKLYDLRMKLTQPKKAAVKPTDFKPDKQIVNSHIPDKDEKGKAKTGDGEVEAEIQKAMSKRR
jgi:hypothetical protein